MAIELTPDYFDNVVVKMNAAVDSLLAVFLKVARNRRCTMSCAGNSYCRRVNHGEATPVNQHGTYRCKKNEDTPPGGFRGSRSSFSHRRFRFCEQYLAITYCK